MVKEGKEREVRLSRDDKRRGSRRGKWKRGDREGKGKGVTGK